MRLAWNSIQVILVEISILDMLKIASVTPVDLALPVNLSARTVYTCQHARTTRSGYQTQQDRIRL